MADDVEFMDTDSPWYWYYLADCRRWHQFEDDPNSPLRSEDIELHYLSNSKGVYYTSSSVIDFSVMLQTDLITMRKRRILRHFNIERSCSCFTAAPVWWERIDPIRPYQLITLSELTLEYKTVADYVKQDRRMNNEIVSIKTIQNMDLWELYCRKKQQLMRIHRVKEIQEKKLFHGTDINNVESICKYNFDVRLAGKHGGKFGKGVYFAKHASYADKFSIPGTENTKIIFLARVMTGKSTAGAPHFQKPDHGTLELLHDSCVNNKDKPTIFVIFDSNQIYPEYVIEYR